MPANALVVEVMLSTGLRVSDVLSLEFWQLKPEFTVSESKTGKLKHIKLDGDLLARLRSQSGSRWVFTGRKGIAHRTRQAVWADIKRAAKAMRLERVIAPHSARKTVAVDEFRRCKDIKTVQEMMNHDRIETTLLYLLSEFEK
jgi:site-specific recombinase XerD